MSKLKMFFLLFVLLSPALAFADCADGKYKDCRCSLAVNNGFPSVPDVTMAYCCEKGCGGMGYDGDPRCCSQGTTWDSATKTCKTACVSPKVLVNGVCKTPCSTVTCPSGQEKNGQTYKETTGTCCQTAKRCSWIETEVWHGMPQSSALASRECSLLTCNETMAASGSNNYCLQWQGPGSDNNGGMSHIKYTCKCS